MYIISALKEFNDALKKIKDTGFERAKYWRVLDAAHANDDITAFPMNFFDVHKKHPEYTDIGMKTQTHPVFRHDTMLAKTWTRYKDICPDLPCGSLKEPDCKFQRAGYLSMYQVIESTVVTRNGFYKTKPLYNNPKNDELFSMTAKREKYGTGNFLIIFFS